MNKPLLYIISAISIIIIIIIIAMNKKISYTLYSGRDIACATGQCLTASTSTKEECEKTCDITKECVGYVYYPNIKTTNCWNLKGTEKWFPKADSLIYVKEGNSIGSQAK